jgi:valyl-tRNA synthetase
LRTNIFIALVQCSEPSEYKVAAAEVDSIRSLSGKGIASISVLGPEDSAPSGSAVYVASSTVTVFLEVRGRVVVDELLKKTRSKMEKATETVTRQRELLGAEGWTDKVSEAVRDTEATKLKEAEAEERSFAASLAQFEKLKLEE